jgi:integrase
MRVIKLETAILRLKYNRELANKLVRDLTIEGKSSRRILKYLRLLAVIERVKQKSILEFDDEDINDVLYFILTNNYSNSTKYDYINMFAIIIRKYLNKKISKPRVRIEEKPKEILTEEEVMRMLFCCKNIKEKTIIALLYEAGIRVGELLNLSVEDINIDSIGVSIMVEGKTGRRRIRLNIAGKLLLYYIRYYNITSGKLFNVTEEHIRQVVRNVAKRAGIKKRVYPHLLRHSRATHLAKYLTEEEMKLFFGWSKNSRMVSKYTHLSMRDIEEKIVLLNNMFEKKLVKLVEQIFHR